MTDFVTQLLADDFVFLEGPRWHDGFLWFSDMHDLKIFKLSAEGKKTLIANVPNRPSGLGFLPDNTLLVASMIDRTVYKVLDGELEVYADLSDVVEADINDLVVDDKGRSYVGNFGYDIFSGEAERMAEIVLIDNDGSYRVVAEGLHFPNGMVIKNNGTQLVVAETLASRLTSFDINEDGSLSNQQIYANLEGLTPDGICLDVDGCIWISSYMTGDFARVAENGSIDQQFKVDGAAVACQLGGPDLQTLYCLTCSGIQQDIDEGKRFARIETIRVNSAGADSP